MTSRSTSRSSGPHKVLLGTLMCTLAASHSAHSASCGHAAMQRAERQLRAAGADGMHASVSEGRPMGYVREQRLLQTTNTSLSNGVPLRITVTYGPGVADLSTDVRGFVQLAVVPTALRRLSQMLSLAVPAADRLWAHRSCSAYDVASVDAVAICTAYAVNTTCDLPDGGPSMPLNASMLGADPIYTRNTSTGAYLINGSWPAGPGIVDANMHVFISAATTPACSGGSLGYAGTCQRDAWDRPTFGRMNLCPAGLAALFPAQMDLAVLLVVHELMHALGFAGSSFPLYRARDASRTPLTPRDVNYPWKPQAQFLVTSPCGGSTYMASNSTIRYFSERGMSECIPPAGVLPTSACVAKIVTPTATAAARAYFNCSLLNGAELENQDTGCDVPGVSPVTLAILHDSGWYTANFSAADTYRKDIDWGYQQGCAFAMQACIAVDTVGNVYGQGQPQHYINEVREVCRIDRTGFAQARVQTYAYDIPGQYQYLSDVNVGGDATMEWCPWRQPNGRMCSDASFMHAQDAYYGSTFSNMSMCLASTLSDSVFDGTSALPPTLAACYPTLCMDDGRMLIAVRSAVTQGSGMTSVVCAGAGDSVSVAGYTGSITCPDVPSICAPATQIMSNRSVPIPNYIDASALRLQAADLTPLFGTLAPTPTTTPSLSSTPTVTASHTSSPSSVAIGLATASRAASGGASSPGVSMPAYGFALVATAGAAISALVIIVIRRHIHKSAKRRDGFFDTPRLIGNRDGSHLPPGFTSMMPVHVRVRLRAQLPENRGLRVRSLSDSSEQSSSRRVQVVVSTANEGNEGATMPMGNHQPPAGHHHDAPPQRRQPSHRFVGARANKVSSSTCHLDDADSDAKESTTRHSAPTPHAAVPVDDPLQAVAADSEPVEKALSGNPLYLLRARTTSHSER